jgi:signal transduction histidine kinase
MNVTTCDSRRAAERWTAFVQEIPLRPIRSEADYDQMVAVMNQLLESAIGRGPSIGLGAGLDRGSGRRV